VTSVRRPISEAAARALLAEEWYCQSQTYVDPYAARGPDGSWSVRGATMHVHGIPIAEVRNGRLSIRIPSGHSAKEGWPPTRLVLSRLDALPGVRVAWEHGEFRLNGHRWEEPGRWTAVSDH
jgi:hypothetical protein